MHYKPKRQDAAKPKYVGIRLTEHMHDMLVKLSQENGWSKSYIIYMIIEKWLKEEGRLK